MITKVECKPFKMIGCGDEQAEFIVYIANRPPIPDYEFRESMLAMQDGEIESIARLTGNHWRKVFNVYAKMLYELDSQEFTTWQLLRDQQLLRAGSKQALLFNNNLPCLDLLKKGYPLRRSVHIIMGKTYASQFEIKDHLIWLNESFAVSEKYRVIVCPYFDYRQLSNIKIEYLADLIKSL